MTPQPTTKVVEQRVLQFFATAFSDWVEPAAGTPYTQLRQLRARFLREREEAKKMGNSWVKDGPLVDLKMRKTFGDWLATQDADVADDAFAALGQMRDTFIEGLAEAGLSADGFHELVEAAVLFVRTVHYKADHESHDVEGLQTNSDFEAHLLRLQEHVRGFNAELTYFKLRLGDFSFLRERLDLSKLLDESLLGRALSGSMLALTHELDELDDRLQRYAAGWQKKKKRRNGASADFLGRLVAIYQRTGSTAGSFRKVVRMIYRALPPEVRGRIANSEPALERRLSRMRARRKGVR